MLIAYVEESIDSVYIIGRLSSLDDPIPARAYNTENGETAMVLKAREGEAVQVSGGRIDLTKGDAPGAENLVLGQQLRTMLNDILLRIDTLEAAFRGHVHADPVSGNVGPTNPTYMPDPISDLQGRLDDILSQVAYTERGAE